MADLYGYNQLFTDVPEMWTTGGQVSIGATGAPTYMGLPSGIVKSFTRLGTGQYRLTLQQAWFSMVYFHVSSEIASSASPAYVTAQMQGDTVGVAGTFPQTVTFQFNVAGTPTELPSGSSFRFLIMLKRSSA